jgi:UPF0042 nucleotide-binding protein
MSTTTPNGTTATASTERPPREEERPHFVLLSGLSGAGKSVALHTLEDLGYYCVDNLPVDLLEEIVRRWRERPMPRLAVGIDARGGETDFERIVASVRGLARKGWRTTIIFLDASNEVLLRRYGETRRRHPLGGIGIGLGEVIRRERTLLGGIADAADIRLDTTQLNVHQLHEEIRRRMNLADQSRLVLSWQSFAYRSGAPADADFVFDVRCLPNPYWDPELRPLSGLDPEVQAYLEREELTHRMLNGIAAFLDPWLPVFESNDRMSLVCAVGCTGGRHRSVAVVEHMAARYRALGRPVLVRHRDLVLTSERTSGA